jgi:hypothetical protein
MYREDGSVGFGISWETIKIKWLWGLRNTFIESLELVPFEWNSSVLLTVGDEESVFLDVFEAEWLFRQWGMEGCIGWHLV